MVIVAQRPAFLMVMFVFGVVATVSCAVAAARWIVDAKLSLAVLASAVTLVMGFSSIAWFRQLKNRQPIATFTPLGVTNERGETFEWSRIQKIWKFTGVLFLRDDSKRPWVVRLDPAEVSSLTEAIEFIKQHAPRHLTERF